MALSNRIAMVALWLCVPVSPGFPSETDADLKGFLADEIASARE